MPTLGWLVSFLAFVATSNSTITRDAKSNINPDNGYKQKEETLILTHVLFRHGNRTADGPVELYPKDPYVNEEYFPVGLGQLTNTGKRKEYQIGKTLRKRYENFLGKHYYHDIIEPITTDYNRTKMSIQLVLAGLFPPTTSEEYWENGFAWQPVPYNYLPKYEDKILLGVLCPRYLELYEEVCASNALQAEFNKHTEVFEYISKHTGLQIKRFLDLYNLYFGISTEEEWGFQLPAWTEKVWPETITNLAIRDYYVAMTTPDMRKIAVGYFLGKVLEDTKDKVISSKKQGRKMHLYSAHENNIAELLIALDVFEPHVPIYGSFVALEVHRIDGIYGIKIFYERHPNTGVQLLKMPKCQEFCPLDKFITLVQDLIPKDDLCGI